MVSWQQFAQQAPDLADAGMRRLTGEDGVSIGFLATVSASGESHIAPVCPVFCDADVFLVAARHSPKFYDLVANGRYALHAFLGDNDEEFQFSGIAEQIDDRLLIAAVHAAIPFGSFDQSDPIFRLQLNKVLWSVWENAGQPDTKQVKQVWSC